MLSRLMALFREKVENRYYGKYRAVVTDNRDPAHRGRLKVKAPALLGEAEIGWAMPCLPYAGGADRGFYMIPEVDDGVWVEFEAGSLSHPVWSGAWWAEDEAPLDDGGGAPEPDKKIIKTRGGHLIQLDDAGGSESVTVVDREGNKIVMNSDGVEIDADTRDLTIKGNNITVEALDGLKLKGASVDVEASGNVTVKGAVVDLNP